MFNLSKLAARGLTIIALLLFTLSAYHFRYQPQTTELEVATILMLVGGAVLWLALYFDGRSARASAADTQPNAPVVVPKTRPEKSNWPLFFLGVVLMLILTEINANTLGLPIFATVSPHLQFLLLIASITCVVLGLGGIGSRRRRKKAPAAQNGAAATNGKQIPQKTGFRPHTAHILLLLITVLAFVLRAWQVGELVHKFVDEIHFSTAVIGTYNGLPLRLLVPFSTITAFPGIFPYWQTQTVYLLGRNLEGLRAVSVILGTLGIPALYLLARTLFDRPTALLAAFMLAVFPPHIHFSRIGLNNIADPLFGTLALAFLLRGLKNGRRLDFAAGGAALGLTQYFYEGGRFLYPALICVGLAWLLVTRQKVQNSPTPQPEAKEQSSAIRLPLRLSAASRQLPAFFLAALVVGLPIYITLVALQQPLDARFQTVGIGGSYWLKVNELGQPQTLEQHFVMPFLVYVHLPELALYYGGEQPMLLPVLVPFFLVGVFTLVARFRSPAFLIIIWVLITSAGNMLLTSSAIYARYVVVFPALTLLTAVGVGEALRLLWPRRFPADDMADLMTVIGLGLAVAQVAYYFGPHLQRYNEQSRLVYDAEDAMFRSAQFPYGTQIHVFSEDAPGSAYLSGVLGYLTDGLMVYPIPPQDLTTTYLSSLLIGVDHAFFIEPDDAATLALIKTFYDVEGPFFSPYRVAPERQLALYYFKGTPAG